MSNIIVKNLSIKGDNTHIGNKYIKTDTYIRTQDISTPEGREIVEKLLEIEIEIDNRKQYLETIASIDKHPNPSDKKQVKVLSNLFKKLKEKGEEILIEKLATWLYNLSTQYIVAISESWGQIDTYIIF